MPNTVVTEWLDNNHNYKFENPYSFINLYVFTSPLAVVIDRM